LGETIRVCLEGGVAQVRLNRPEKLNALNPEMMLSINEAIGRLSTEASARIVVLSGEGRAFCAGLDTQTMASGGSGFDLLKREFGPASIVQQVAWGWRSLRIPVIAAVHGVAFGGGLQLASGADIRIGASMTRFSIRETFWGLVPDMAGVALWRTSVRDDVLRELTYTAREFDGVEAERHGFLTRLADDPVEEALEMARMIASRSPDAVAAAKRLYNLAADADAASILAAESSEQVKLKGSYNQKEAVAAYVEKRAPMFGDRA
jgi:enoyl-CoA hydratase/carnithine racemase